MIKIPLKRTLITLSIILFSTAVFGQNNETSLTSSAQEEELIKKKSALGIRFGYFSSIALSYQRFVTPRSALDVSFGYRPSGGFVRWAEDMERVGAVATYSYYYPIQILPNDSIFFYWSLGWHAGQVSYPSDPENGKGLQTGPLFGIGLDLRFKNYSINLGVLPGYDLALGQARDSNFFLNKASGIAVRYIF